MNYLVANKYSFHCELTKFVLKSKIHFVRRSWQEGSLYLFWYSTKMKLSILTRLEYYNPYCALKM